MTRIDGLPALDQPSIRGYTSPMSFSPSRFFAAAVFCAACLISARGVQLGDTEDQVLAELGKPTARVASGGAVRLTFPRGTVRIANGSVTAIDLESAEDHARRIADEATRRETSAREAAERLRMRTEEGERIRAEREADPAFQALPPQQRVTYWRQFMARFPGVKPGADYTTAALQLQAAEQERRKVLAEEKRLRELEDRVAKAEERADAAERKMERQERRMRSGNYYGVPYYYYAPLVPVTPKPRPEPRSGGPTIMVNGFEQFQTTTNKTSVGFGVRIK